MLRSLILGFLLFFTYPLIHSQQIRTYVNKTQLDLTDELKFYLAVFGNKLTNTPDFPEIPGFDKGPEGYLLATRGQMDEMVYRQTYYPRESGKFEIPSFMVSVAGENVETGSFIVEVESGFERSRNYIFEPLPLDAHLTLELDSATTYIGQQVLADVFLTVRRRDVTRMRWDVDQVAGMLYQFNPEQLRVEPIEIADEYLEAEKFTFADVPYQRYHLLRCAVFPMRSGELEIEPIHIEYQRQWEARNAAPRDIRKGLHIRFQTEMLSTDPVLLNVLDVPHTDLPRARSVGQFSIYDSLPKKTFSTGENIRLTITLSGDANFAAIPRPYVQVPEDLLFYDPVSSYSFAPDHNRVIGQKDFVFELMAAYPGNYSLGPVVFYYFNPETSSFDSLKIDQIPIAVTGEEIPQLLEVNILDNFYRNALRNSSDIPPKPISFSNYIILILAFAAGMLLILALLQWSRFMKVSDQNRKRYTEGYKKIVENRKR